MEEMYNMSIVTHNYGVMLVLGVILINVLMILRAKETSKYRIFHTLFMPIGSTMIGVIVFTGIVMMAAKHLEFTLANIAMIIFAITLIFLEFKRSRKLKYTKNKDENGFVEYKSYALKVLMYEAIVTLSISFWMWA